MWGSVHAQIASIQKNEGDAWLVSETCNKKPYDCKVLLLL